MEGYEVREIESKLTYPFLLSIHYAKRIPSISYAYGLYNKGNLVGVITYGTPPSSTLRMGLAGKENIENVIELNRLCLLNNLKNEASYLVSKSLKMLPKGLYIISFADSSQNHIGIVYQACNFIYLGLSAKRTDWVVEGLEHLHGVTIADKFRGVPNRAQAIREEYGDKFKLVPRARKHRYLYITATKNKRRQMLKSVKYKIEEYPKGS
jgi:hypothetical protein